MFGRPSEAFTLARSPHLCGGVLWWQGDPINTLKRGAKWILISLRPAFEFGLIGRISKFSTYQIANPRIANPRVGTLDRGLPRHEQLRHFINEHFG